MKVQGEEFFGIDKGEIKMPIETEEILRLKEIYKPWIANGKIREDAPQCAKDAYDEVMNWYYEYANEHQDCQ